MTYAVEIIKSMAWPVTVLILAYVFKEPIRKALDRLSKFSAAGLEAEFTARTAQVVEDAQELISAHIEEQKETSTEVDFWIELKHVASESAVGAIVSAWIEVEKSLRALKVLLDGYQDRSSSVFYKLPQMLFQQNIIDEQTLSVLFELREIRNIAVHEGTHSDKITPKAAQDFVEACKSVNNMLQKALVRSSSNIQEVDIQSVPVTYD